MIQWFERRIVSSIWSYAIKLWFCSNSHLEFLKRTLLHTIQVRIPSHKYVVSAVLNFWMKNMSEILKTAGQSNISTMFSSKLARSVVHELEAQWFMKNKLKCEKLSETEDKGLKVMTSHMETRGTLYKVMTSHGSLVHWDNKTFRVGTLCCWVGTYVGMYTVLRWAPEYSGPRPVNLSVFI
jgi:hypothetical protein